MVYFHRFFARKDFSDYDRFTIATACLFLAGKVEETPKKLRDVLAATFKLRNNGIELRQDSHQYAELKERVLVAERVLLQAISFDLSIDHPFRHIVSFIKSLPKDSLPKDKQQNFAQVSWNFCNDSCIRTTLCIQFRPKVVAAAALMVASKMLQIELDKICSSPLWEKFDAKIEDLHAAAQQILDMYQDPNVAGLPAAPSAPSAPAAQSTLSPSASPAARGSPRDVNNTVPAGHQPPPPSGALPPPPPPQPQVLPPPPPEQPPQPAVVAGPHSYPAPAHVQQSPHIQQRPPHPDGGRPNGRQDDDRRTDGRRIADRNRDYRDRDGRDRDYRSHHHHDDRRRDRDRDYRERTRSRSRSRSSRSRSRSRSPSPSRSPHRRSSSSPLRDRDYRRTSDERDRREVSSTDMRLSNERRREADKLASPPVNKVPSPQ